MTLQRFLNGVGDWRWTWLGVKRWKPRPAQRFPWSGWLVLTLVTIAWALLGGVALTGLVQLHPLMKGSAWPLLWAASVGAVGGGFSFLLVALAWNRRAARLTAAGLTEPPALAPTRWWQRWLVGPFYALLLFLVTPLGLWLAGDSAVATFAWKRSLADLKARGEPMDYAELQGPPPAAEDNFAQVPLIRALWKYDLVETNHRTELVWADPTNRARCERISVPQNFRPHPTGRGRATNDGRVNLDWIARSIRTAPADEGPTMSPEMMRRYGLVASPTSEPGKPRYEVSPEILKRTGLDPGQSTTSSAAPAASTPPPPPPAPPKARLTEAEILALPIPDPAGEVLEYLKRFEPELREISAGLRRPRSRFESHWERGMANFLPYLAHMKSLSLTYRIRATARLAKGDTAGAFDDAVSAYRLADGLAEDPVLISFLVRIAQTAIAYSTMWQGMADHRWTEPQLAEFQERLARIDFQGALIEAFRGERIGSNTIYEEMLGPSARLGAGASGGGATEALAGEREMAMPHLPPWAPRGMFRRNQINHHLYFDAVLRDLRDPAWPRTLVGRPSLEEFLREVGLRPVTPRTILPAMLAPAYERTADKAARQIVTARLGQMACALERYRLRQGKYPDDLGALVPAFLKSIPLDPMDGKPVRYAPETNGWYRLWSVGLNGRDDDGTVVDNDQKGDWVWPVPVPSTGMRLF